MNRETILLIMKFAIVLMALSLVLFFITEVGAVTFIAICVSMIFCSLVFIFGLISLTFGGEQKLSKKKFITGLLVWLGITAVCIAIKIIVYYV